MQRLKSIHILLLTLVGGNFLFIIEKQKIPPLIVLSITIRIACNMRVWHHAKIQAQDTIIALCSRSFLTAYIPICRDSGIVFQY